MKQNLATDIRILCHVGNTIETYLKGAILTVYKYLWWQCSRQSVSCLLHKIPNFLIYWHFIIDTNSAPPALLSFSSIATCVMRCGCWPSW